MKVAVVKELVNSYTQEELADAEDALLNELQPDISIPGDNEGEQLTHVLAALWVQADMHYNDCDIQTSLRSYSIKVRKSID